MRINRAIGLGIGILVLQSLMSQVFASFEDTLITAFDTTQTVLTTVDESISSTTIQSIIPTPGVR